MKNILFIYLLLLFISTQSFSQGFGSIYIAQTKNYAMRDMNKNINAGKTKKSITFSSKDTVGDSLNYVVKNNKESFTTKMTFKTNDTIIDEMICDYQSYLFECPKCAQKHLDDIIAINKFRQKDEHTYYTNHFNQIEMNVLKEPERITLIFRESTKSKREFNKLYKSLAKPISK